MTNYHALQDVDYHFNSNDFITENQSILKEGNGIFLQFFLVILYVAAAL